VQKEEIYAKIHQENGLYILKDETFDDFINWNVHTFVCFHEENEEKTQMLKEFLIQVREKLLKRQLGDVYIGMINVEHERIVQARYNPLRDPDFKLFYNSKPIPYPGTMDISSMALWIYQKTVVPT